MLKVFQTMPIVNAVIDPATASTLMELPWVNYIEPDVSIAAAAAPSRRVRLPAGYAGHVVGH